MGFSRILLIVRRRVDSFLKGKYLGRAGLRMPFSPTFTCSNPALRAKNKDLFSFSGKREVFLGHFHSSKTFFISLNIYIGRYRNLQRGKEFTFLLLMSKDIIWETHGLMNRSLRAKMDSAFVPPDFDSKRNHLPLFCLGGGYLAGLRFGTSFRAIHALNEQFFATRR